MPVPLDLQLRCSISAHDFAAGGYGWEDIRVLLIRIHGVRWPAEDIKAIVFQKSRAAGSARAAPPALHSRGTGGAEPFVSRQDSQPNGE